MMATRGVGYYLDAIEAILDVRVSWDPKLFADLTGDLGVITLNDGISKCGDLLAFDLLDDIWQLEFNNCVSVTLCPWLEPPLLPIVVAASHV